jgi:hypothetical protein
MQPILNSQDRNQAFLKFLTFFLITVLLVVVAIYYNYKVPDKENAWLQSQLDIQQIQDANQAKFVSKMEEAITLMDQWNNKTADNALIDTKLNKIIGDMSLIEQNDKSMYGKMNKAIVAKFNDLRIARKALEDSKNDAQTIQKQTNTINELNTKLNAVNARLDNFIKPSQ